MEAAAAIVLLSGGIDSAVALAWSLREGHRVLPVTFDYHLRPRRELEAAGALVDHARRRGHDVAPLERVALPFLREVEDLSPRPPHLRGAPEGYVPARNLVFYSVAASLAEARGASLVVGGHNGGDPELFPDAGPRFFAAFNDLLVDAAWSHARSPFRVATPLAGKPKGDVLRLARDLGVPLELTWSCYADGKLPCGKCGSCAERREGFAAAGLDDPLVPR